jgi:hypothetical protein
MLVSENIEKQFIELLQHEIEIIFNRKVIKTGKLLLLSHKSSVICLTLQLENQTIKSYELPYPFDIQFINEPSNKHVVFDYNIANLTPRQVLLDRIHTTVPTKKPHRFLTNKVFIKAVD